jgi:SprT-like family
MKFRPIMLAAVALLFSSPVFPQDNTQRMTEKQAKTFYYATRSAYFAGELPSNIEIKFVKNLFNDPLQKRVVAQTKCQRDDKGSLTSCLIELDWDYNNYETGVAMVLFHEECHIRLWHRNLKIEDQHGPEFQACMLDLAQQGAFNAYW